MQSKGFNAQRRLGYFSKFAQSSSKCGKSAYTLAEIIIVMLVIAVVVGVSIKITKAKLNQIVSYTYYSAYSTLRNVSGQMLQDFKTKPEYTDTAHLMPQDWYSFPQSLFSFPKGLLALLMPKQKVEAGDSVSYICAAENIGLLGDKWASRSDEYVIHSYDVFSDAYGPWFSVKDDEEALQRCRESVWRHRWLSREVHLGAAGEGGTVPFTKCPGKLKRSSADIKRFWDYSDSRNDTYIQNTTHCNMFEAISIHSIDKYLQKYPECLSETGGVMEYPIPAYAESCNFSCYDGVNNNCGNISHLETERFMCPSGSGSKILTVITSDGSIDKGKGAYWEGDDYGFWPVCKYSPETPSCEGQPTSEEIRNRYHETGDEWVGSPECAYKPTCNKEGYKWDPESETCIQEPPTLPRKGSNFCEKFVSYTNTKTNSPECTGDAIADNTVDFSSHTPDITLRNGMFLYNVSQNPAEIAILEGNTMGGKYDGVDNINSFGYTIYVDIDGGKGASRLWEDVYKFYITMSGKVVPAYNETEGAEATGGDSRQHLMTSVMKEEITADGHRQIKWMKKSVLFKEGACSAGYIQGAYCQGGQNPVSRLAECSDVVNNCTLKYISPVKFF